MGMDDFELAYIGRCKEIRSSLERMEGGARGLIEAVAVLFGTNARFYETLDSILSRVMELKADLEQMAERPWEVIEEFARY
jgi:hypothetical protein